VDFESTTRGSNPRGSSSSFLSSVGRAVDCSSICHLFDSDRKDHSPIAQLVERATVNREVIGSNPVGRETQSTNSSVVERAFSKRKARSSNLLWCIPYFYYLAFTQIVKIT
jgi:hypothetical protein